MKSSTPNKQKLKRQMKKSVSMKPLSSNPNSEVVIPTVAVGVKQPADEDDSSRLKEETNKKNRSGNQKMVEGPPVKPRKPVIQNHTLMYLYYMEHKDEVMKENPLLIAKEVRQILSERFKSLKVKKTAVQQKEKIEKAIEEYWSNLKPLSKEERGEKPKKLSKHKREAKKREKRKDKERKRKDKEHEKRATGQLDKARGKIKRAERKIRRSLRAATKKDVVAGV